jgi:hypothetical protein
MKQLKMIKPEGKTGNAKPTPTTTTRLEIDACVKDLARLIGKDPKKAAKVFESWLGESKKPSSRKKAA